MSVALKGVDKYWIDVFAMMASEREYPSKQPSEFG